MRGITLRNQSSLCSRFSKSGQRNKQTVQHLLSIIVLDLDPSEVTWSVIYTITVARRSLQIGLLRQ